MNEFAERIQEEKQIEEMFSLEVANAWCEKNQYQFIEKIGDGGYSFVYSVSKDNETFALKISSSFSEAAFAYDIVAAEPEGYVRTHSVERVHDKCFIILMDMLEFNESIKNDGLKMFEILEEHGFCIQSTEKDDVKYLLSEEQFTIFSDIQDAIEENSDDFHMLDVHEENIGYDNFTSSYILIDQYYDHFSIEEYRQIIDTFPMPV